MKWFHWVGIGIGILFAGGAFNRQRVMNDLKKVLLGKNFTLNDFVKTVTGIENVPGETEIQALRDLVKNILQPLRDRIAKPIRVTSGYRSPGVNAAIFVDANKNGIRDEGEVGSSKTSQHMKGQAADIQIDGMTNQQIVDLIRSMRLPYDQLIDEVRGSSKWVHVSFNNSKAATAQRLQWLTRRDFGGSTGRATEYETVKYGYA